MATRTKRKRGKTLAISVKKEKRGKRWLGEQRGKEGKGKNFSYKCQKGKKYKKKTECIKQEPSYCVR